MLSSRAVNPKRGLQFGVRFFRSSPSVAQNRYSLSQHYRFEYSAIPERAVYSWPEGKKLAVYIGLNLENFHFGRGLGAQIGTAPSHRNEPDVLNYSWREYGNRVGVWRILDMLNELEFPASVLVNTSIYEHCPSVIAAFRKRGDEMLAHGYTNSFRQGELDDEHREMAIIRKVTETMEVFEGKHPRGWLSPWISESYSTVDLLEKLGYKFVLDWCHDDQPTYMNCGNGHRILSIPYQQEINDIPAIIARNGSAPDFTADMGAAFDELLLQTQKTDQPLVFGIALHPYIVGQPHRLKYLRQALEHVKTKAEQTGKVWFTRAGSIADHVEKLPEGVVP